MTMQQHGEPSVEEILDSIKKVIARDNREGAILERRRRAGNLTRESEAEPADPEEAEEVLELVEETAIDESLADEYDEGDNADSDALTRGDTREAMRQNFAALAMLSQPGKQPQIVRSGETSLEGLVREMLRPMLAEWLDANLPGMVEDLVKAEISRIAGKRS
jgi:cell pole-organizing protein PopZ